MTHNCYRKANINSKPCMHVRYILSENANLNVYDFPLIFFFDLRLLKFAKQVCEKQKNLLFTHNKCIRFI